MSERLRTNLPSGHTYHRTYLLSGHTYHQDILTVCLLAYLAKTRTAIFMATSTMKIYIWDCGGHVARIELTTTKLVSLPVEEDRLASASAKVVDIVKT